MSTHKRKTAGGKVTDGETSVQGQYANYFKVGYNAFEFVFDFGQSYTGNDQAELYTRLILAPAYAKSLLETLKSSVENYESNFGDIDKIAKKSHGAKKE